MLGPRRLATMAREARRVSNEIRGLARNVTKELEREIAQLDAEERRPASAEAAAPEELPEAYRRFREDFPEEALPEPATPKPAASSPEPAPAPKPAAALSEPAAPPAPAEAAPTVAEGPAPTPANGPAAAATPPPAPVRAGPPARPPVRVGVSRARLEAARVPKEGPPAASSS